MDDLEAIHRCQRGEMEALEPLMERYQSQALRIAYLLTGDAELAEDIAQDGFVQAFRAMRQFDASRPFTPWLYRIITNTARERMRARRRLREVSLDNATFDASLGGALEGHEAHAAVTDPATRALQAEERAAIFNALDALTQKQREAIILRYYLGCGDHECAAIAGCREGAFRVRLHGALQALKPIIRQRYPWLLPADSSGLDTWEATRHVAL